MGSSREGGSDLTVATLQTPRHVDLGTGPEGTQISELGPLLISVTAEGWNDLRLL